MGSPVYLALGAVTAPSMAVCFQGSWAGEGLRMPLMHQDEILGWRLPKAPSSWRCPPAGPQLTRMPGACSSGLPPCRWTKACGGSFVWTAVSLGCAHSCGVRHLAPSRFHLCNWMGCSCFKGAPLTLFTAPWWVEAAGQHSWSKLLHLPVSASCTMLTGFYTDSQLSRNGLLLPGWKPHLRGAGALWGLGHADSPHKHGLCVSHSASLTGAPGAPLVCGEHLHFSYSYAFSLKAPGDVDRPPLFHVEDAVLANWPFLEGGRQEWAGATSQSKGAQASRVEAQE